ncbi:MAG: hypothetical protein L0Z73_04055 [Gammaproteobacteria bacterium]|nr:hypothetical protein [Gammaproteobacteria bacterium]
MLALSACGSGLDGTYADQSGITKYKFESGGKVYVSMMGVETELKYEVDGDKVKIAAPGDNGANQIYTLQGDGSLSGPMGLTLTKQK